MLTPDCTAPCLAVLWCELLYALSGLLYRDLWIHAGASNSPQSACNTVGVHVTTLHITGAKHFCFSWCQASLECSGSKQKAASSVKRKDESCYIVLSSLWKKIYFIYLRHINSHVFHLSYRNLELLFLCNQSETLDHIHDIIIYCLPKIELLNS